MYKMCQIDYRTPIYVLWNNKIHCFIIPVYNIPRKCNLLPLVPYKGTYHIMLLNGIHTSCMKLLAVIFLLQEISNGG